MPVSGAQEWSTDVTAHDFTTDGHNYIFMCEHFGHTFNLLSQSDGKKLGCFIKKVIRVWGIHG